MKLILEDYEDQNDNDTFQGTFYYGNNMVIAQISTEWIFDPYVTDSFGRESFDVYAVVLSAEQRDENDNPTKLTITNEEIEKFVENEMDDWFENYFEKQSEIA